MRFTPTLTLVLATLLFAGCGGGGGGDTPAAVQPTVTISQSNQGAVARATIDGGQAVGSAGVLSDSDRATAQSVSTTRVTASAAAVQRVARIGLEAAFAPRRSASILSATRQAVIPLSSVPCTVSGSIDTAVNDVDNSQALSVGDSLSITFNSCKESASDLMTGALVFTIGSVAQSQTTVQFSGSMAFQAVTAVSGQETATINGSVGVAATITSTTFQMVLTIGADGLTVTAAAPGFSNSIVYDPGMQLAVTTTEGVTSSSSVSLNGSFSAASIGGRVLVTTVAPVVTMGTDDHPTSGQVVVTGAAGTHLRVTALNNTQAQLDLDANGDGTYETSAIVTWVNLGS